MKQSLEVIAIILALAGLIVAVLTWLYPFNPIGNSPVDNSMPAGVTSVPISQSQRDNLDTTAPSTLSLYDTFDNPTHDGHINEALWVVNINDNMGINQNNGKLILQASEPNDYGALWINPTNGVESSLRNYNFIEASFSWEPNAKNKVFLGLTVQQSWSPRVVYGCDFILTEDTSVLHCSGVDGDQTVSPNDISVVTGRAYKLRFEINPTTATFVIYLDDTLIDSYNPPFPEKWLQGQISYDIHVGAEPGSIATAYVDDVRFGKLNK